MAKKVTWTSILPLCFALTFFLFSGCGSASEESYENELQELSKHLSAQLHEAAEGAVGEHAAKEAASPSSLAETFSEMADLLEEGVRELSWLKVPAGREKLQSSLLELLKSISTACRNMANILLPAAEGHADEGGSALGDDHAGGNAAVQGGAEHEVAPKTETHGAPGEDNEH